MLRKSQHKIPQGRPEELPRLFFLFNSVKEHENITTIIVSPLLSITMMSKGRKAWKTAYMLKSSVTKLRATLVSDYFILQNRFQICRVLGESIFGSIFKNA